MDTFVPWLTLVDHTDEVLSAPCEEIEATTVEVQDLARDMVQTMYTCKGIGLAAPQVGRSIRLVVTDCSEDQSDPKYFVNPHITESTGRTYNTEGCLSFPGLQLEIHRASKITVKAYDLEYNEFEYEATGIEARCLQHEIDHLDGITFLKRVSRQQRRHALRKWEEPDTATNSSHTTSEI